MLCTNESSTGTNRTRVASVTLTVTDPDTVNPPAEAFTVTKVDPVALAVSVPSDAIEATDVFDDDNASVAPENAPPTLFLASADNAVALPTATEAGGSMNDTDPNNGAGMFAGAPVGARVMSR